VYVADETGVIWKWIPVDMLIHKTEKVDSGFKVAKHHITLLFAIMLLVAYAETCSHI
jgi:hypothetical protein